MRSISCLMPNLVSTSENVINDKKFLLDLHKELESLGLYSPSSRKPTSMWFSVDGMSVYEGKNYAPNDLKTYPSLLKLLGLVNEHPLVKAQLDCLHILCYSDNKHTLRLHAHNEPYIDGSCPIATVSIGASRKIEFVPFGNKYNNMVKSVTAVNNSMYVMNPGCQTLLQHRVTPGNSNECTENIRYSLSFRKFKSSTSPLVAAPIQPTPSSPQHKTATSLLIGDSFLARIDAARLGKGKKHVINLAKGGSKIPDAIKTVEDFNTDPANTTFRVDQVFVSIGTNDIRYCKSEGIMKFKGALFQLIRTIKSVFAGAKIFFQSLLPLPHWNRLPNEVKDIQDVNSFNSALKKVFWEKISERINSISSNIISSDREPD